VPDALQLTAQSSRSSLISILKTSVRNAQGRLGLSREEGVDGVVKFQSLCNDDVMTRVQRSPSCAGTLHAQAIPVASAFEATFYCQITPISLPFYDRNIWKPKLRRAVLRTVSHVMTLRVNYLHFRCNWSGNRDGLRARRPGLDSRCKNFLRRFQLPIHIIWDGGGSCSPRV
jgi:hypothetical protein